MDLIAGAMAGFEELCARLMLFDHGPDIGQADFADVRRERRLQQATEVVDRFLAF
jgi:ABC-type uncharacterized transport system ATPase subunit